MDLNASAFRNVQELTAESNESKRVAAGRAGGKAGGPARAATLTAERRREIAVKANESRWRKRTNGTKD